MADGIKPLQIGPGFTLPAEYCTQPSAILASTGAGKSNLAVVIAEELYDREIPWCAVDPKGDWHGVTSSRDGKKEGLSVVVFGGENGHLDLDPGMGKAIARVVAEERLTCVLDLSEFDTRQLMFKFLADFATTLLSKNRHPLHVFAEECDDYLPQTTRKEGGELPRCIGAWARLVKRGRQKGIGSTQISQRAASITWDTLGQAQNLFAMRVTAARDVTAIKDWLVGPYNKPTEEERALLASLRDLQPGEAWFWSPSWIQTRERIKARRRRTFDSGATPKLGEAPIVPARRADVDLAVLGTELAAAVERQKAEDPAELRQQIAQLRRDLAAKPAAAPAPPPEPIEVEVQVLDEGLVRRLEESIEAFGFERSALAYAGDEVAVAVTQLRDQLAGAATPPRPQGRPVGTEAPRQPAGSAPRPGPETRPAAAVVAPAIDGDYVPKGGALRLLHALAPFPGGLTKSQAATHAHLKKRGGTFGTYLSQLRTNNLVDVAGDLLTLTDVGRALIGAETVTPLDDAALRDEWHDKLKGGAQRMFDALVSIYPDAYSKEQLAQAASLTLAGGTFGTYLSVLRTNGLVEENAELLRASESLYL